MHVEMGMERISLKDNLRKGKQKRKKVNKQKDIWIFSSDVQH